MAANGYIVEQYPSECEKEMDSIFKATWTQLKEDNHIDVRDGLVAYTVVQTAIEQVAVYLKQHPESIIEFEGLLRFSTNKEDSEKGEKGGNIVPVVEIGEKFKLGVKNDDETEEDDDDE